jgi:hypothetical protein
MTETGVKLVVAAVATAVVALVVAVGAVAVALTAIDKNDRRNDRDERTVALLEQRLLVLCRREVVVGGRLNADGLTLKTEHGC